MTIMPSVLPVLISTIKAMPEVDDSASDLVGFEQGMVWVRVNQAPGSVLARDRLFQPNFDFNIYGPNADSVESVSRSVMQVVSALKGFHNSSLVITDVDIRVTPHDFTDWFSGSPRYVFSAAIACRSK
ncbi:MAG TPA: hypothetical protein VLS45_03005 [Methylomicrobium sp.]|nr:hypothetical protein [Methylomicrobium sp.]